MNDFPVTAVVSEGETLRVEALPFGVKRLVLNRPEVRNAFDETMIGELSLTLEALAAVADPMEMRLLLIEGKGKVFSAGADLGYMKRLGEQSFEKSIEDARGLARLFYRLADFPVPVVAYVQGAAIGGGLGLTVCADYVVAEERALFATSEVRLGIVPGVISPFIIRKVGLHASSTMMLSGARLSAWEAAEVGLVQSVAEGSERSARLQEAVVSFLEAGPLATRRTKRLIKRIQPLPDPDMIEFTARQIAEARGEEEARQGLSAFFTKKVPPWAEEVARVQGGGKKKAP